MSLRELFFGFNQETINKHPECFNNISIDPRDRERIVPMEVLSLGMSRTGTASMYAALTSLGYNTYHGFKAFADIRDYDLWLPAYECKYFQKPSMICPKVDKRFFDKVLGHMSAVTDMPAASFALELIEAYPEAKIILVQRDEDEWYTSFYNVFIKTYDSSLVCLVARLDPRKAGKLVSFLVRGVAEGQCRAISKEEFERIAIPMCREHYQSIRKLLQDRDEIHRLLEYELSSGWEPLCRFLERSVPDVDFPRINETAMINEKIMVMVIVGLRKTIGRIFLYGAPLLVAIVLACWCIVRR